MTLVKDGLEAMDTQEDSPTMEAKAKNALLFAYSIVASDQLRLIHQKMDANPLDTPIYGCLFVNFRWTIHRRIPLEDLMAEWRFCAILYGTDPSVTDSELKSLVPGDPMTLLQPGGPWAEILTGYFKH